MTAAAAPARLFATWTFHFVTHDNDSDWKLVKMPACSELCAVFAAYVVGVYSLYRIDRASLAGVNLFLRPSEGSFTSLSFRQ